MEVPGQDAVLRPGRDPGRQPLPHDAVPRVLDQQPSGGRGLVHPFGAARHQQQAEPVPGAGPLLGRLEDHRVPGIAAHLQLAVDDHLPEAPVKACGAAVAAAEADPRAGFQDEAHPRFDDDVAVDHDLSRPGGVGRDVTLDRLAHEDIEAHAAAAEVANVLDGDAERDAAVETGVRLQARIGAQVGAVEAVAVEGIGGVPPVAVVFARISLVAGPEIEVVAAPHRVGLLTGIAAVGEQPVGADEVDLLVALLVVVRPLVDVPDQQPARGYVAVVEAAGVLAVLDQEVLLLGNRYAVHRPAAVDLLHLEAAQRLGHLDEVPVLPAEPAQLRQRPGAEGVGAVLDAPSEGAQPHQPPLADPGAVEAPVDLPAEKHRRLVEQVGKPEHMGELVAHGRRGHGEDVAPLGGPPEAGETAAHADVSPAGGRVVADEVGVEPEGCEPGRGAQQEVHRHREQVDEDDVDVSVVVPGIRHPVGAVVVEAAHVDVGVGLGQDLEIEARVVAGGPTLLGQIGGRGLQRAVALRQDLPPYQELASRHLVVEVGEAARQAGVEEVVGPGGLGVGAVGFTPELGEDHQGVVGPGHGAVPLEQRGPGSAPGPGPLGGSGRHRWPGKRRPGECSRQRLTLGILPRASAFDDTVGDQLDLGEADVPCAGAEEGKQGDRGRQEAGARGYGLGVRRHSSMNSEASKS